MMSRIVPAMVCGLCLFAGIAVGDITIEDSIQTYPSLSDTIVYMTGNSELHLTSNTSPLTNCQIHLNSPGSWLFLEKIKPSVVNTSAYLSQIRVNGAAAVQNSNVRIVEYVSGAIVIPHSPGYQPLQVYSGFNFTGSSMSLSLYTYYKGSASLGSLNNQISSFKLKRGYMATFGQDTGGSDTIPTVTGVSRVYLAQDRDINIAVIPEELNDSISFVRVVPWRWTSKKGWAGGGTYPDLVDSKWNYDWDNVATSTLDREYVPMRHNAGWNAFSNINNKQNSTHVLGFNEPDKTDQANMTVEAAISMWPALMASGLRLGSPATSDGGLSWLYDFIDQADALNYRVDFVAVHKYHDGQNIASITSWLAAIHDRTGRPLWVTEWNDGCNWTGGDPTDPYAHAARIDEIISAMDAMPFVERYAVYNGCSYRELISGGVLTPAGEVYLAHQAPAAYAQVPGKGGFGCAYYMFDNNTLDSLFYQNHGSAQGGAGYAARDGGQAIDLDGTNDYVILPENLADTEDFTFAAWIYWDGGNQWQRIFDFGHGNTYYMMLTPRSGGNTLRFDITTSGNTSPQRMETTQLTAGQWIHVAVTISGNTGKLFVNGSQVASNTNMTINPLDLGATSNYLGRSHYVQDPLFNGRLDEVHIADYALTNAQITALYNGTAGNIPPAFRSDPVIGPDVLEGTAYKGILIYEASDFDEASTSLTFSKISGPAWLSVASDGTLTGTPGSGDDGVNTFVIRVTDSIGAYDEATLTIWVEGLLDPPTNFAGTAVSTSQIDLSWDAVPDAISYKIARSTVSGGPYTTIAQGLTGTTYSNTGLLGNLTYYYIIATVNDNGPGPNSAEMAVTTLPGLPTPWQSVVRSIPGQIEAEYYDDGGQNVSYYDTTAGNSGGQFSRTYNDVDLFSSGDVGGGYAVGDIETGEWLLYTVSSTAATVNIYARVASTQAGNQIKVRLNETLLGTVEVPDTGSLTAWATVTVNGITLPDSGTAALKLEFVGSGFRLNWIVFQNQAAYLGYPSLLPGRIQFEDFDTGGQNISYYDTTTGNTYSGYRTAEDVDIMDFGGGFGVYMSPAEWMEYTCTVEPGFYSVIVRHTSNLATQTLTLSDGSGVVATFTLPKTNGWSNWQNTEVSGVFLSGGEDQVLRFTMTVSTGLLDYVDFIRQYNPADLTLSGRVDMEDFAILSSQWQGEPNEPSADIAPAGGDNWVDLPDLITLTENWLILQ